MGRGLAILIYVSLAGAAVAVAFGGGSEPNAPATRVMASSNGSFVNSADGTPIFGAADLAPGESTAGTVEISYDGEMPGELTLEQEEVVDDPGLGGGELSRQLSIEIADVTAPGSPTTVYAGALAPMPPQRIGLLAPGESRTYEFVATLPAGAPDQNGVQGAGTSIGYAWRIDELTERDLRLKVIRIGHRVRRGRLLVWARCDRPCRISAGGRLRLRRGGSARLAKLHSSRRSRLTSGKQRLAIRVPRRYRRWLAKEPRRGRATARIVLRARAADGETDRVRRRVHLRRPPGAGRSRR